MVGYLTKSQTQGLLFIVFRFRQSVFVCQFIVLLCACLVWLSVALFLYYYNSTCPLVTYFYIKKAFPSWASADLVYTCTCTSIFCIVLFVCLCFEYMNILAFLINKLRASWQQYQFSFCLIVYFVTFVIYTREFYFIDKRMNFLFDKKVEYKMCGIGVFVLFFISLAILFEKQLVWLGVRLGALEKNVWNSIDLSQYK